MPHNNKIFEKFDKEVMRIVVYAKAASINAHVDCISSGVFCNRYINDWS